MQRFIQWIKRLFMKISRKPQQVQRQQEDDRHISWYDR